MIDAGHGGRDPGATSVSGQVSEKDLTLALARELRDDLVKRGRVRVAMTRDDDRYLTLDERAAVARRLNAALFVSLHMDSAPNPLARGATRLFALRCRLGRRGRPVRRARERRRGHSRRRAARIGGMLSDLAMQARCARPRISPHGWSTSPPAASSFGPTRTASPRSTCFAAPEPPAVLFEAGYISNADDEVLLRTPEHRSQDRARARPGDRNRRRGRMRGINAFSLPGSR